jgi:predicted transcriptional regulator
MKEKRKKCPNCKVEYVYRVDWNKVSKGFYRRIKAFAQTQERHKQEVLMSIMADWKITKKVYDAVTNKMVTVEIDPFQSKWTKELESEFFERLNEFTESKKENIKKIESDVYSETCTFKPAVNRLKAEVEDDEGYDAFRAFMERYEADWERRLAERQRRMKQMDE